MHPTEQLKVLPSRIDRSRLSGATTAGRAALLGVGALILAVSARAGDLDASLTRLMTDVRTSVVAVEAYQPVPMASPGDTLGEAFDSYRLVVSSGVLLDGGDHVVTVASGVDGCDSVVIRLPSGDRVAGTLQAQDPDLNIALLRVLEEISAPETLPTGPSLHELLEQDAWVAAMGYAPGDEQPLLSIGKLTGLSYAKAGHRTLGMLRTSAPIFAGCSGGALVDLDGRWVGLLSGSCLMSSDAAPGANLVFSSRPHAALALPVEEVLAVVERLRSQGYADEAFLGVEIPMNAPAGSSEGIRVLSVVERCPAHGAGLSQDDVIRRIDGRPVSAPDDLKEILSGKKPGQKVRVEILRGGSVVEVDLELGSRLRFEREQQAKERALEKQKQLRAMIRQLERMLSSTGDSQADPVDASPSADSSP